MTQKPSTQFDPPDEAFCSCASACPERGRRAKRRSAKGFSSALHRSAFTLIELLTSMAILGVMMVVLFSVFDQINKAWLIGENRVETFADARAALDLMSRELSQAIATNIPFYGDATHVYFVAPVNTGPTNLSDLCEVGYEFEQVVTNTAANVTLKIARRLIAPTALNCAGFPGSPWNPYATTPWWNAFYGKPVNLVTESSTALASNRVFGLHFQYYDSTGALLPTPYSQNKLPYAIAIIMSNVDSRTAVKLNIPAIAAAQATWQSIVSNSTPRVFSTTVYFPNIQP
jgi:prepilin-type N-terminal cleavage/methylation domain-containing protein